MSSAEPSRPETARSELQRPGAASPETARPEPPRPGAASPDVAPILDVVEAFVPGNAQEKADRALFLDRLAHDPHVLVRDALAHVTVSAWTVDPQARQTLLVYHDIYRSWSWIGGHADGDADLRHVALKELGEETGLSRARLVDLPSGGLFSLEVLTVNGHERKGRYVSSHLHLNVTYLAVALPSDPVRARQGENSDVRWADLDQVESLSSEPWIRQRIYRKLVDRTRAVDPALIARAAAQLESESRR